jgi:hypothetical protein
MYVQIIWHVALSSSHHAMRCCHHSKCVGKKRFNGSVTHGLRKEHVLRSPPFLDKVRSYLIFFLMVICNSLLLLKSLPINVINCIHFHVSWLSDFFFYPKTLYKSLHQSFFYSFITILPAESGVTLHYSTGHRKCGLIRQVTS